MFVSCQLLLPVAFHATQARLENLTHGGWLSTASGDAYSAGLAGLIRVGPFGNVLGASKLVKVSLLEPVPHDGVMVLPLRWEATGVAGRLFPVLDADLTVTPAELGQTLIKLDGAYRPPLGAAGATVDRVILGRAADATVRSLLTQIADGVASPALETGAGARFLTGTLPWRAADPEAPA